VQPRGEPITFTELAVPADLVAALARQDVTEPTDIQRVALPVLLAGDDAYLNSETGTGKTLAYLLPIVARLDPALAAPQAMVVAPTHELALQIHHQCCDLAQHAGRAVRTLLLIGGTPLGRQLDNLKARPHLVVGSPGRIRELMTMGKLKTAAVRTFVVDEADRLLAGDELPVVRAIAGALPASRQLVFASATRRPESEQVIAARAPGCVPLRPGAAAVNADIVHSYIVCEERDKPRVLRQLIHALAPERALVFAHLNTTVERVAAQLAHHGLPVAELHAGVDKRGRQRAMDDFRAARVRVLVASDVAARGLDIPGVTHVFNLDVPTQSPAYLHRVGRTGRAGAPGEAITLMTENEVRRVRRWEGELGIVLQRVRLREGRVLAVRGADPGSPAAPPRAEDQPARPSRPDRPATKRA
jgi:superfamily II DNA/RNA helicase